MFLDYLRIVIHGEIYKCSLKLRCKLNYGSSSVKLPSFGRFVRNVIYVKGVCRFLWNRTTQRFQQVNHIRLDRYRIFMYSVCLCFYANQIHNFVVEFLFLIYRMILQLLFCYLLKSYGRFQQLPTVYG